MAASSAELSDEDRSSKPDQEMTDSPVRPNGRSRHESEEISTADESPRRPSKRKSPTPDGDDDIIPDDEGGEGLFGSGSEDEVASARGKRRRLSDEELDSGDDIGRRDRVSDDEASSGDVVTKEYKSTTIEMSGHQLPRGSDGEIFLLKLPSFMSIEPRAFTLKSFQLPTTAHHGKPPGSTWSAQQTANTTIRWRRDPKDPEKLQSNARIIRWSDGSLTLQLGSSPTDQYELEAKAIVPPSAHPLKPGPTKAAANKKSAGFDPKAESHAYLSSSLTDHNFLQLTNRVTTSLVVKSSTDAEDDAIVRLQEAMSAAAKGGKGEASTGPNIIDIREDPEMEKRRAEQAEKERLRAERRRQNQAERQRDRASRVLGRAGLRGPGGAGLDMDDLEGDDGDMATASRRSGKSGARAPKARRSRRPDYSDEDEDEPRRGRTREDEYDEDDGFLVGSDEEPEVVEDDDEEEEEVEDDRDRRGKSSRQDAADDEDADADADADEDVPVTTAKGQDSPSIPEKATGRSPDNAQEADGAAGGRSKRRRVLDDDDEDEEE